MASVGLFILRRGSRALRLRGPLAADSSAQVLQILLLSLCGCLIFDLVMVQPRTSAVLANAIVLALGFGAYGTALAVLQKGSLRAASVIYLVGTWLMWTIVIVGSGGIHSPGVVFYVAITISAAWLLGFRAVVASGIVCLASSLAMAVLEMKGFRMPAIFPGTPIGIWCALLTAMTIAAVPAAQVLQTLRDSLAKSRDAEFALRESEERLRLGQDAAGIGAFEWNIRTGVNTWTPKLEELYGLPVGAFGRTQKAWENLVHPEDRAEAVERVQQAFETGEPGEAEFRVIWPDGSVHWLYGRWQVVKDAGGTPLRLRGVNIDITDRRQTEERLRHAQKLESIGRLAGGLAHDYNNLMSIILLHADSAFKELSSGELAGDSVAAIRDAAEKAVALGQQLMAFSSKRPSQPEVLDLNSVTSDTKKLVQRLIGEDVAVTFNPGSGLRLVKADRGQLVQIMMNLAVNSRDAMPQGGAFTIETANVEFNASDARLNAGALLGPYVMLVVRDTGHGMDEATQARIFEPFFTTKAIGKGTGLGLSVVYGIVRQSGGFITVSSEPGHGAEFRIYLPAVLELPKPILQRQHGPVRGGSETILVVEDEPALRQKIREVMENVGYRVLVARDGDEGTRLAIEDARQIHLLLTDVVMANISGPRLSERLRTTRPDTKTLYMSGYPDMGEGSEALRSQTNFIEKPFTQEVLLRRVREVLDSKTPQG